jgi:epoxyqueuosine reductase
MSDATSPYPLLSGEGVKPEACGLAVAHGHWDKLPIETALIKSIARGLGADVVGVTRAAPVTAKELFLEWLTHGYSGGMDYLAKHREERFDPCILLPGAKSIVVIGMNYHPTNAERAQSSGRFKVARYAWGEDYHRVLRRLLKRLRSRLKNACPGLKGRICVDTAPFMDKYWAQMAGLGWQGKHTNLVSREFGSWLVLGSLIIDAEVDVYDAPHLDFCGTCTACLESCPTHAFPQPYVLDATKCISYWTIETKAEPFPEGVGGQLNGWVFGCDICLDACPWNKFEQPRREEAFARAERIKDVEEGNVATMTEARFTQLFADSPITRPTRAGLRRNIESTR